MTAAVSELLSCLRACLVQIDQEIEQRQCGGNDEDWAQLSALSDRSHAAVRQHTDAARRRWHEVCEAMNRGTWSGTEAEALAEVARCKAIVEGSTE